MPLTRDILWNRDPDLSSAFVSVVTMIGRTLRGSVRSTPRQHRTETFKVRHVGSGSRAADTPQRAATVGPLGDGARASHRFRHNMPHPFSQVPPLGPELEAAIDLLSQPADVVRSFRRKQMAHWEERAAALQADSSSMISQVCDKYLKDFFTRDVPAGAAFELGQCTHLALW